MQIRAVFLALALALAVSARPAVERRAAFTLQNGQDAIALKYVIIIPIGSQCTEFLFVVRNSKPLQPTPLARQGKMLASINSLLSA
jgi:hypothetical protein